MADGWPPDKVFAPGAPCCSLDEVVFLPGPALGRKVEVELSTRLTRNVGLRLPIVGGPSAATGADVAIALALLGGIGIIPRSQSILDQAAAVRRVKQYENGLILNPFTLGLRHTVADALRIREEHGCSGIPITDNGRVGGKLVGIVTARDLDAAEDRLALLTSIMTRSVVFVREPVTLREARTVMQQSKVGKLPVVSKDLELVALICRGDAKKAKEYPEAARDANRQLLVAAAVAADEADGWERAQALIDAGVDVLFLDTDRGVNQNTVDFLKQLKAAFANTEVVAGRVTSCRQAKDLLEAGADGLRVGAAAGSEATAIYEIARFSRNSHGIPVMADVGVRDGSQMLKALALGAATVTLDFLLARTHEAPGDHIYVNGARVKVLPDAWHPSGGRQPVELGLPGPVVDKGAVAELVAYLAQEAKFGLQELGVRKLADVGAALAGGEALRLERQSPLVEVWPRLEAAVPSPLHDRW